MYALGIYRGLAALLKKEKGAIEVISLHEDVKQVDIRPEYSVATGLETRQVVRREVVLKLKREKEILKALPFQIEASIPFPLDQTILAPLLYPEGKVVVFAAAEASLKEHLSDGIEPDIVSALPAALARYAALHYPDLKQFYLLHDETALAVMDGKIAVSQSFSPEEKERARAHVLSKCGPIEQLEELPPYAAPIGLALEALAEDGHSLQFLQGAYTSPKEKKREASRCFLYGAVSLCLCLTAAAASFFISHAQESALQERLDGLLGESGASLETRVEEWRGQLAEERKQFPLHAPVVPLSDFLAWASDREEEIDIVRLHYSLVKYPKMGANLERYQVKVDLELTAPTPTVARAFLEALRKSEKIVDTQKEISWTPSDGKYRAAFYLRNTV